MSLPIKIILPCIRIPGQTDVSPPTSLAGHGQGRGGEYTQMVGNQRGEAMRNVMEFEGGYKAVITYDPEIEMFRGEFVGLNGGAGLLRQRR